MSSKFSGGLRKASKKKLIVIVIKVGGFKFVQETKLCPEIQNVCPLKTF
jgi:hypothetical protein